MSDKKNEGTTGANVIGFQIPQGIKKRKSKVDEMLTLCEDINEGDVLSYFNNLGDAQVEPDEKDLDEGNYVALAERIREFIVREIIRNKLKEVVRKKEGGGGYVLYSPNQGKKKHAKAVGTFPTKLGAKKAELSRFPPKDPQKLARLRKEVERLMKDPKKRAEREAQAARSGKKEGVELATESRQDLKALLGKMVNEALFHEEAEPSHWEEYLGKLPKQAVAADKKFASYVKNIEKKSEKVLGDAFSAISKRVDKKQVKLKSMGTKVSENGKSYLAFTATMSNVEVGPIAIYIEGTTPRIELSDQAKAALTKVDPKVGKLFRAELVTVQESVLDKIEDLGKAVQARDSYLSKLEGEVDGFVADLTPLQVSILKNLLVKKYRKLG